MNPSKKTKTIFAVLGFLNEYSGRYVDKNSDLIEAFYANEQNAADIFNLYLKILIKEYNLSPKIERKTEKASIGAFNWFHSFEIKELIDSYYLSNFLTGKDENEEPIYTSGKGFFRNNAGFISEAIFSTGEEAKEEKMSFLIGAHHRYGVQNSFKFANATHKARLIERLLKDVGSPNVLVIKSHPDSVPFIWQVAFEPTPELVKRLNLKLEDFDEN